MNTKITVGWSYPTSPNAVKFGCSKTGGWTVKTETGTRRPRAEAIFATKEEAVAMAHCLARELVTVAITPNK